MPFGNSNGGTCEECGKNFVHLKKLSEHIKKEHNINPVDYVIKHRYSNVRPLCLACNSETRYVSLSEGFKRYCINCRNIAESLAGKIGGRAKRSWNKGLTKDKDMRLENLAKNMLGENNPFFGKKHDESTVEAIAIKKRTPIDDIKNVIINSGAELLSSQKDYQDQNTKLKIKCLKCNVEDEASFFNIKRCWKCRNCYPLASKQQLDIANYVKSLGFEVEISTKNVINPYEIDVWVPSKKLAIEYHGLYWHSGGKTGVFDKTLHRKKYEMCAKSDIRLMQIFSDEWESSEELCKSMIANALSCTAKKVNARDCKVERISVNVSKEFVEKNHISGSTRASLHFGLFHKTDGLIGVASTRTPIQKKWGHVSELARMCFKMGYSVRGGASKLLSHIISEVKNQGFDGLLSYVELRHGTGNVYDKCGFKLIGESKINYWYTDGKKRYDRFKFRAQQGKSEKQVTDEAGVRAVHGAGNKIYLISWSLTLDSERK